MYCSKCGSVNDDAAQFCVKCGNTLKLGLGSQSPISDSGRRMTQKTYASGKNPILALVLSLLIVGVGQFYNGDNKKGILMLVGAVVLGAFTVGILWFALAIWSAFDAYNVASGKTPLWI